MICLDETRIIEMNNRNEKNRIKTSLSPLYLYRILFSFTPTSCVLGNALIFSSTRTIKLFII